MGSVTVRVLTEQTHTDKPHESQHFRTITIMTPQQPLLHFLFLTTYRPTGAVYVGIHASTDHNFGTSESRDPFIGGGDKVRALKGRREDFTVRTLHIGTYKDCLDRYKRLPINLNHPLCLNTKEGAPSGIPKA
jgi:hypothetical protein